MRKYLLTLVLILAILGSPLVALASDISGAQYYAIITVSNNGTATNNVAATANISTQNLIDGNYLNNSANNCVMRNASGADVNFMPSVNSSYPWCMWVPSIGDYSYQNYILYTANSTGGIIRYFPGPIGMTTPDDPSLEIGDNGTIKIRAYIDTAAGDNKTIMEKQNAVSLKSSDTVSGNITATVYSTSVSDNLQYSSDSESSTSTQDQWIKVKEIIVTAPIYNEAKVKFDIKASGAGASVYGRIYKNGVAIGTQQYSPSDGSYATKSENITLLASAGDKIQVYGYARAALSCYIKNFRIYYDTVICPVSATGITSGEYTLVTAMNSPFFGIGIDAGDNILPVSENLVLNAPLWQQELSGASFTTIDAYQHSGTVTGTTWEPLGRSFDGSGDKIVVPAATSIQNIFDGGGTIELIVSINSDGQSDSGHFLNKQKWYLRTYNQVGETVYVQFLAAFDGQNGIWNYYVPIPINNYYMLSIVYDSSNSENDPIFYKDGVPVSREEVASPFGNYVSDAGIDLLIGNRAAMDRTFDGSFGELRIYNRALTPAEIQQNYLATKWKYDGSTNKSVCSTLATIPDNNNDWLSCSGNTTPYVEYQEITVGGVQRQYVEWEYDTTFHDQSGNNNDATPTFRTASSDPDVTAKMVSFYPMSEAQAPAYVLSAPAPFLTPDTANVTSTFTTTPPAGTFPLAGVITAVANATATPPQLPLLIIAAFVILAASFTMSAIMRQHGSGTIIVKIIVIAAVMGIFVALRNFGIDFWMIFVFLIIGIALAMASKQLGFT